MQSSAYKESKNLHQNTNQEGIENNTPREIYKRKTNKIIPLQND